MSSPPSAGSKVFAGRYSIQRQIGRGATATVFLASDTVGGRGVALKMLRAELAQSTASDRFLREIRLTSQLNHPHILPVLDAGESDGSLYFALPYMEEGSLRNRLDRDKQLPIADAVQIVCTIAEALDHARQRPHPSRRQAGEHPLYQR